MTPMPEFDDQDATCTFCAAAPGEPCLSFDPDTQQYDELKHVHPNRWHRAKDNHIQALTEYAIDLEEMLDAARESREVPP